MEKITKFSEADVGRVAVSEDEHYRIKILSADGDNLKVEYLKEADGCEIGYITDGFTLVRGSRAMYWEDPKSLKGIWLETMPAVEKYGLPAVEEALHAAYEAANKDLGWISFETYMKDWFFDFETDGRCVGIDSEGGFDGWHKDPILENGQDILSFEEFKERLGLTSETVKPVVAKPRFHKPRQKPPVRKKTDVVIQYKTGQTYTLKNVNSVSVSAEKITTGVVKEIEEGIHTEVNNHVDSKLVAKILIKAPGCETEIHNYGDDEFLVYFDDGYCIVRQWFKTF